MPIPPYVLESRVVLELESRERTQALTLSDRLVVCRVLGQYLLYADPEDLTITPHLCLNGYWESWITLAMARLIQPGWYCLDVGANHGYFATLMADAVGEGGHVLAIEPNPRLTELLALTLEANGYQSRSTVLQKAAYDTDSGSLKLVIPRNRGATATLFRQPADADDVVEVESVTLDTAADGLPCVDLIKIDAEGAEEAIWRGMLGTLRRYPEVIVIMEVSCSRYAEPRRFIQAIRDEGFPLRYIDYSSAIRDVSEEQLLSERDGQYWMLFLKR